MSLRVLQKTWKCFFLSTSCTIVMRTPPILAEVRAIGIIYKSFTAT